MDQSLRLRLHVRRNGLPENNVLFNVPLANDPTIANLLELVNDTIPLEDADGEWGLDDYVVEIHGKDSRGHGTAFECLHFQPLSGLLDKDDEVFIRPLLTIDLKKRRLSGRDQILPGGEHIIDGVPFGRPRLRTPRGRPPVTIAPRKRRRLLNDQEYSISHVDDAPYEDLADDDYFDQRGQVGDANGDAQLLLTHHGEEASRPARRVRFFRDPDTGSNDTSDDETSGVEEGEDYDEDEDMAEPEALELANEVADLRMGLTEGEGEYLETRSRSKSRSLAAEAQARPIGPKTNDSGLFEDDQDAAEATPAEGLSPDLALLDKVVAVRAAFNVSHEDAVKLLLKQNLDVSKVWKILERSLKPRQGLAETMVLATQLELPREVQIISSPTGSPAEALGDLSRIDDDGQTELSSSDEEDGSVDSDEDLGDEEKHGVCATESDSEGNSSSSSEYVSARPSPPRDGEDSADNDSPSSNEDSSSDSEEDRPTKSTMAQPRSFDMPRAQKRDSPDSSDESVSSSEEGNPVVRRINSRRGRKNVSISSSSSDTSSDSSTDSSSDSSSEPEIEKEITTPLAQSRLSRDTPPNEKGPARSQRETSQRKTLVPPGQGLTRTQRRNHRRRLQMQFKKAAFQAPNASHDTQDTSAKDVDLDAKKMALLQTLGTEADTIEEGLGQAHNDVQTTGKDLEAWKHKIAYRAVECVQEGVDLSEPPFPFIQRWDPQQRWDSQPNQRRSKRKSRADSQFYNGPESHIAKKRRFEQPLEDYSYQEDTSTFPAVQDDIELDYDDVTFNPDESPMAKGHTDQALRLRLEQAADDLPPLPEDMLSLPVLHACDLRLGMVIAWKQLLCTEATQWQPQLSNYMTASVTETREGSASFQVQLARRDRNFDRNEKKYDEETGQRVYGKFEAPDSDSDEDAPEEEDDGMREVVFPEMVEPRIVQHAAEAKGVQPSSGVPRDDPSKSEEPDSATTQLLELGYEVADSQPKQRSHDQASSGRVTESRDQSDTLDNDHGAEQESESTHAMSVDAGVNGDASFIPETIHDQANSPADAVSITEDRRGEISQLISEGGFSQGVRKSIDPSAFLQFAQESPSRQLEEEYASSVLQSNQVDSSKSDSSSGAPSEYDAKEPMQNTGPQMLPLGLQSAEADTFHSAPQTPSLQHIRSDRSIEEDSTRLTTPVGHLSAGKVEYRKSNVSQTTQASDLSGGRQIDPNCITHSHTLRISLSGNSPMTNGFDDDTALGCDSTEFGQTQHERTPMQQMHDNDSQHAVMSGTPFVSTQPDAQPSSRPQSAASYRSDSSFPDIKFLSSQVAKTKFKASPRVKAERRSSNETPNSSNLSLQPPRLSQRDEETSASPSALPIPGQTNGISGGSSELYSTSSKGPISPPALSRPRQTRASSSLQDTRDTTFAPTRSIGLDTPSGDSLGTKDTKKRPKGPSSAIPKGSQVVSLLTSSPEPEPEPEYSEMYADDSVDDDYLGNVPKLRKAAAAGRRKRGASMPYVQEKEEMTSPGWVGGSQGPSRKASGRFGGRWSSAAGV